MLNLQLLYKNVYDQNETSPRFQSRIHKKYQKIWIASILDQYIDV